MNTQMATAKAAFAAAIALAVGAPAIATETAVEYATPASGTASQSLADGKVQIVYDAADKITALALMPAAGETLALGGDALPFADGAQIVTGADGEAVVSNAVSFDGAAAFGVGEKTWHTGTMLTQSSYTTVFENTWLDMISPLRAEVNLSGVEALPFYVERKGAGASAEMKVNFCWSADGSFGGDGSDHGTVLSYCVRVKLKQNGNNVEAQVLSARKWNRVRFYGWRETEQTKFGSQATIYSAESGAATGFGIGKLVFGPRQDTYDIDATISDGGVVLLPASSGVHVEDLEVLGGLGAYAKDDYYVGAYNTDFDETANTLSVQFVEKTAMRYCSKVMLYEDASGNICAKRIYSKDLGKSAKGIIYDFDENGNDYTASGGNTVTRIFLRKKASLKSKLTFIANDATTLNAISGGNVDVTFKTLAQDASATVKLENIYPVLGTPKKIIEDARLSAITVTGAKFGGVKWFGTDWVVVDYENDGATAAFQIQCKRDNLLQCMDVELAQDGDDISLTAVHAHWANWEACNADDYYNKKTFPRDVAVSLAPSGGEWSPGALATGDGQGERFNLDDLTYTATPVAFVYATGANTLANSSFSLEGAQTHPLEFFVQNANALPAGTTTASGNTGLYLEPESASNWDGLQNGEAAIVMNAGSRLYQTVKEAFRCAGQDVTLDGATLHTRFASGNVATAEAYLNDLVLANGAAIAGFDSCMVGNPGRHPANPSWIVSGTGAAVCDSTLRLVGTEAAGAGTYGLEIDVSDTVAGGGADFVMNGDVQEYPDLTYAHIVKKGAGTMQMNGTFRSLSEPTHIAEGTLLLGISGATVPGHSFTLDGGTLALAADTSNVAGTLSLTATSTLAAGENAMLALAGVSIPEGAVLNVIGASRTGLKVVERLDAATLARINIDGKPVRQDEAGYLRSGSGLVLGFF